MDELPIALPDRPAGGTGTADAGSRQDRSRRRRKAKRKPPTRARKPERRTISVRLDVALYERIVVMATQAALRMGGRGPRISISDALNDILHQALGPSPSPYCRHGNLAGTCGRCDLEGR